MKNNTTTGLEIAIIGMAGKFPDAENVTQFWENLKNGKESISFLTDKDIAQLGLEPEELNNPDFIQCKGGVLDNKEYFDAPFFNYMPKEAEILTPQTRFFLETVWEAAEDAGYNFETYKGKVGLYAGASSGLLWESMVQFTGNHAGINDFQSSILSGREFLCSQTSYKLNLTGPSVNIQTACSTSLVAISNACKAILTGECQIAIAGGVSMSLFNTGYTYEEGMISSKDGHIRTFDADASGAVSGEGVGIVVLKLLKKAIQDRDNIHAVIKGAYTNNDGNDKVGYTAPGVSGQAKVILSALRMANVEPESIGYVEAHGTATALGDVTEIEALRQAFNTDKKHFCSIGSVKTNIGHLDAAAGVAGFIKTVLSLKHKQLVPSLNYTKPNPSIDFENSPFLVNTSLKEWKNKEVPLRAGVSSFGIGGTNAHVILEEAPMPEAFVSDKRDHVIILSARTEQALDKMTKNLVSHLKENPELKIQDVAYTLQVGRKGFAHRRKILCESTEQAVEVLSDLNSRKIQTHKISSDQQKIVFLFSGLGAQYKDMCSGLYQNEPAFREAFDTCDKLIHSTANISVKEILYSKQELDSAHQDLHQLDVGQFVVFAMEYALSKLLISFGIKPDSMIGYSFGEYVAATLSGVFSLEDAIRIINKRGELIKNLPSGVMLSVPLTRSEVEPLLDVSLSLAIDNGPSCIIAGTEQAISGFEKAMKNDRIVCMRLESTRAVHSREMDPILNELEEFISGIELNAPNIPYISNVTGDWAKAEHVTTPAYWIKHVRQSVLFAEGIKKICNDKKQIYIEIGPGSDITALVNRQLAEKGVSEKAINLVRPMANEIDDLKYLTNKMGQLWLYGASIDWIEYNKNEKLTKVSLPSYPFERQRYGRLMDAYWSGAFNNMAQSEKSVSDYLYLPTWKRSERLTFHRNEWMTRETILVFTDQLGISKELFAENGISTLILVAVGESYKKLDDFNYNIDPSSSGDIGLLFADLIKNECLPDRIVHMFGLEKSGETVLSGDRLVSSLNLGYYSLLSIAQAISSLNIDKQIKLDVIGNGAIEVLGDETINPEKSIVLGTVKVIPQEYANIRIRYWDICLGENEQLNMQIINALYNELYAETGLNNIRAIRGNYLWLPEFENVPFLDDAQKIKSIRPDGVYLVTGGLGGVALNMVEFLSKEEKSRFVLLGRSDFPSRENWDQWLEDHNSTDVISEKILQLKRIEENGSESLILKADISSRNDIEKAIHSSLEKFGKINGVIHSATVADGAIIALREKEMSEDLFKAKLYGTMYLNELLPADQLDVIIYCSTLSSILGGFGQVAYCASNIFLDTFATYLSRKTDAHVITINWDRWRGTGIARITEDKHRELANDDMSGGISAEHSLLNFRQVLLHKGYSQMAVSEVDLASLVEQSKYYQEFDFQESDEDLSESGSQSKRIARPDLTSDYEEAKSPIEEKLVQIWGNFFDMEGIGVNDNFFELGGDSLKGMVLLKRVKKELNFEVGIKVFFQKPTIRSLAHEIVSITSLFEKKERSNTITI